MLVNSTESFLVLYQRPLSLVKKSIWVSQTDPLHGFCCACFQGLELFSRSCYKYSDVQIFNEEFGGCILEDKWSVKLFFLRVHQRSNCLYEKLSETQIKSSRMSSKASKPLVNTSGHSSSQKAAQYLCCSKGIGNQPAAEQQLFAELEDLLFLLLLCNLSPFLDTWLTSPYSDEPLLGYRFLQLTAFSCFKSGLESPGFNLSSKQRQPSLWVCFSFIGVEFHKEEVR